MSSGSTGALSADAVARLARLHVALVTPYDANGEVSSRCLRRVVDHVVQQGVDGFYIGGSTGEGLLQSTSERLEIFAQVAEFAAGKTLIGHVGALSTREARELAKGCNRLGYDAVSAIPPIYFPHRKEAIIDYYRDIAEAADGTPVIIYNIPAATGVSFNMDDLAKLLALPNVVGIKQTSMDMYQMEQLRRAFPSALLLNGYDEVLLAGLVSGANGGVGSTYNVMGDRYRKLVELVRRGDVVGAASIQAQCNTVIDELVRVGVFPGLKYLLHRLGVIDTPLCREPLVTLTPATAGKLDSISNQLGLPLTRH